MKWNVRIEVGNYCNLRCPLCVRELVDSNILNSIHLSPEDVKNFLPRLFLLSRVDSVYLSGAVAEPTLNRYFIDIVEYLIKYTRVVIDSNGSTHNVDWWAKLGATGVNCDFGPDSIKPNNNKYRINSDTDKVIKNIQAFVAAGGVAEWKFIPYAHNEDELEEQKLIAESIGAKFTFIQPRSSWLDNVQNSSAFVDGKDVEPYYDKGTPNSYCKLFGNIETRLIEISPEGIVYPCCMMPRQFYGVYRDYFANGNTAPDLSPAGGPRYKSFLKTVVPLIEDNGGIESLSLYKHSITDILKNKFYTALKKSWDDKEHFCYNHCDSAKYKLE